MYQQSLNRYRKNVLDYLKRSHDRTPRGSTRRRSAARNVSSYENETDFAETIREAVTRTHCVMDPNSEAPLFDGLYRIDCAYWARPERRWDKNLHSKNLIP